MFETVPFVRSLANSFVVAALIAVGQAFLCSLAGFAFAKMTFKGRDLLFLVLVLTMTVPAQLAIIPQYMIMSTLGWVDTLQALVVPGLVSAFGIFWMRQHISATISDELLQARAWTARTRGRSSCGSPSRSSGPRPRCWACSGSSTRGTTSSGRSSC